MTTLKIQFTEPEIVTTNELSHRSYVTFYFYGKRVREYNAKAIGKTLNPNRAETIEQKQQLLKKLQFEYHKALEANLYPNKSITGKGIPNNDNGKNERAMAIRLMFEVIRTKLRTDLSKTYKRDLKSVYRDFKDFISLDEANGSIADISTIRIEKFLSQFGSSGTYYMNKRRNLGVIINGAGRLIEKELKTVKETKRRKAKAKLHIAYETSQLKPILSFLQSFNPNLYLCCLLTYGTWLRPHEEVRLLTAGDFKANGTEIHLSGTANKGGKVRVVYVPEYIQKVLSPLLTNLPKNYNIFTLSLEPFNESYFNTAWSRALIKMRKNNLVDENQTLYSFRHTAAVQLYKKTKDVHLLQKLLGHSSLLVTLKYLRSLGEFSIDDMKSAAPTL